CRRETPLAQRFCALRRIRAARNRGNKWATMGNNGRQWHAGGASSELEVSRLTRGKLKEPLRAWRPICPAPTGSGVFQQMRALRKGAMRDLRSGLESHALRFYRLFVVCWWANALPAPAVLLNSAHAASRFSRRFLRYRQSDARAQSRRTEQRPTAGY